MAKKFTSQKTIYLLFLLLLANKLYSQDIRFTRLKVGIDPIYSSTWLINNSSIKNKFRAYHNWEVYSELIGPYRLSFVGEFGQSKITTWSDTYSASGTYGRFGFNFDLTEPHINYEFDLGWRIGYANFREVQSSSFPGTVENQKFSRNSAIWSEFVIDYKFRLFPKSPVFKDFWIVTSGRIKVNPMTTDNNGFFTQYIPGYGLTDFPISGALQVYAVYSFHLRKSKIHKSHHLNDTFEILEDHHHIKKIKKFHHDADEIDRD